jgi:hypothetical protein
MAGDSARSPCNEANQTPEHMLQDCPCPRSSLEERPPKSSSGVLTTTKFIEDIEVQAQNPHTNIK